MLTAASAETISGAILRHVLLARQVPGELESIALNLPRLDRHVRAAWGTAEQVRDALQRETCDDAVSLQLLMVPDTDVRAVSSSDLNAVESLRLWVLEDASAAAPAPLLIQLQGVLICVGAQRIAVSGTVERMTAVTGACLEFFWLQREVQGLEQRIDERWQELDEDTSAAFEVLDSMLERRACLQERFQRMIAAKARVAKLAPLIECPVIYPPTLASQAAERLREKSRLSERLEHLREQLDVFERVYELCAQRLSDFTSSRKSHHIEWIIVVLLAFEVLLLVIDLLGTLTDTQ